MILFYREKLEKVLFGEFLKELCKNSICQPNIYYDLLTNHTKYFNILKNDLIKYSEDHHLNCLNENEFNKVLNFTVPESLINTSVKNNYSDVSTRISSLISTEYQIMFNDIKSLSKDKYMDLCFISFINNWSNNKIDINKGNEFLKEFEGFYNEIKKSSNIYHMLDNWMVNNNWYVSDEILDNRLYLYQDRLKVLHINYLKLINSKDLSVDDIKKKINDKVIDINSEAERIGSSIQNER